MSNKFLRDGRVPGWDASVRMGAAVYRAFFLTNYPIRIIFTYGIFILSIL